MTAFVPAPPRVRSAIACGSRRLRLALATAAVGAALVVGCREDPGHAPASVPGERRIVAMAPAAAETLAMLGAGEAVVGVGDFVAWPPELAAKPRVGAYDAPNVERVLALGADLYVTAASAAAAAAHARLEAVGVEVLALDTSTFEGTFAAIAAVGERTGRAAEATALVADIRRRLGTVAARAAGAPRRRVLVVVGREPLYVAGPGSHLDRLLAMVGAENVAAGTASPYPLLSFEAAIAAEPEVIVDLSDNRPGAPRGAGPGPWSAWPFLPAVAAGEVHLVDPTRLVIPGPRLADMAELLARLVHPELFGRPGAADYRAIGESAAAEAPR